MIPTAYPDEYLSGVELFNRQQFFECHEVWENLWREADEPVKQFYKGLIQAAVSLLHLREGNLLGARKLFAGAQHYLGPFRPRRLGLDVDAFLAALSNCFRDLPAIEHRIDKNSVCSAIFPQISLNPPAG